MIVAGVFAFASCKKAEVANKTVDSSATVVVADTTTTTPAATEATVKH